VRRLAGQTIVRAHDRLRSMQRVVRRYGRIARHLIAFRAPDELRACPVCGHPRPVPLLPLPLEGHARSFGFASGCERCGVVFANPLPVAAQVAQVYSPDGAWGRHRQAEEEPPVSRVRLERLFEPVAGVVRIDAPPPGARVLDFGCGLGGMLDAFAALGWETFGIEPAVKTAFSRHRELLDVPTSPTFDIAILHHVLEHVTDPLTILRRMADAMHDDAVLLISVPNLDEVSVHGELKYCIRAGVHVLAYTSSSLAWLLAEAGFEPTSDRSSLGAGDRGRHRMVLAARRRGPVARPARPLDAAREALARYAAMHEPRRPERFLPVRTRAALLDLRRTEWRV
jgi:SAM-dependent methyltransferase